MDEFLEGEIFDEMIEALTLQQGKINNLIKMNIERAIREASQNLKSKKIKSAVLDSEILMSKVLSRNFIMMNLKEKIDDKDYNFFKKLVSSRLKREPIAYLTGVKSFWKYNFKVNNKVLIPRPDTEVLIEQVLENYKNKENVNFLEIGTGSGCIILSILKEKVFFRCRN